MRWGRGTEGRREEEGKEESAKVEARGRIGTSERRKEYFLVAESSRSLRRKQRKGV